MRLSVRVIVMIVLGKREMHDQEIDSILRGGGSEGDSLGAHGGGREELDGLELGLLLLAGGHPVLLLAPLLLGGEGREAGEAAGLMGEDILDVVLADPVLAVVDDDADEELCHCLD